MNSLARKRQRGVTLMELMVVMVIIGILSAIAIPSYRQHTIKVKRTDAKTALMGFAQRLEQCYSRFNAYNDAGCVTGLPFDTEDKTYRVTGALNANSYVLTATAINAQAGDAKCGDWTLNQAGAKTVSGTSTADDCW